VPTDPSSQRPNQRPAQQPTPTGVNRPTEAQHLLQKARQSGVRFINLEFTDIVGLAKCVTIPVEQLPDTLLHGKWFDGSSIEGVARAVETDMYLRPDLDTFALVPWRGATTSADTAGGLARLICDVLLPTGAPFDGDPRAVLASALDEAARRGYRYEVAPELEFFLVPREELESAARLSRQQPLTHDRNGYFDLTTDRAADVRREIVAALGSMGIAIESSHHEVAPGQHEIDFVPGNALRIADALVTARYVIKAIAERNELRATFLPKPFFGLNGSGMHIHQQLVRLRDGANALVDSDDPEYGLSRVARQFIAGQLAHARGMCALLAPLVNSYKRLVPGFEAPVMVSWGRFNREALVRVPRAASGMPGGERIELRSPDPSCNPYLAFALMLRAGLDGIARDLPLPPPVEEDLYELDAASRLRRNIALLPRSLGEALDALRADQIMREALGETITEWFLDAKQCEWDEYRTHVYAWELERYLPVY
jgi:glutamine synthetase